MTKNCDCGHKFEYTVDDVKNSHRLLVGDATKREDVERLIGGEKADMVFTSPPYWVGFEYENEDQKETILEHIDMVSELLAKYAKRIVINTGNISSITVAEKITGIRQPALLIDWWRDAMNKNNFLLRHIRVWAKYGGVKPSRKSDKIDMHWEYIGNFTDEYGDAGLISTFNEASIKPFQNDGTRTWAVTGVWTDIVGKARGSNHVAAFPVTLPGRYLQMYTKKGDSVLDCYGGSGSTLIAAEQTNRKCFTMEISERYADVILSRWATFTGKDPIREDGMAWSELNKTSE